jgi:hypothetical protein
VYFTNIISISKDLSIIAYITSVYLVRMKERSYTLRAYSKTIHLDSQAKHVPSFMHDAKKVSNGCKDAKCFSKGAGFRYSGYLGLWYVYIV